MQKTDSAFIFIFTRYLLLLPQARVRNFSISIFCLQRFGKLGIWRMVNSLIWYRFSIELIACKHYKPAFSQSELPVWQHRVRRNCQSSSVSRKVKNVMVGGRHNFVNISMRKFRDVAVICWNKYAISAWEISWLHVYALNFSSSLNCRAPIKLKVCFKKNIKGKVSN